MQTLIEQNALHKRHIFQLFDSTTMYAFVYKLNLEMVT